MNDKPVEKKVTGVNLPENLYDKLREAAFCRSKKLGGKISVSAVITDILEKNLDKYIKGLK